MLVKEIVIRGSIYKIMCAKDELDRVDYLTSILNSRIDRIANSVSKKTTETMILILTMLELMDDIESHDSEIKDLKSENYQKDATIRCMFSCLENIISRLEEGSF